MKLNEARGAFIDQWGALASSWGVPRSVTQIYALLLVNPAAMNTDEIIEALGLSRGNISMSMKELIEWGLIYKVYKPGDRKDYFEAEKDMWIAIRRIMAERKRKELDPILRQIDRLTTVKDGQADPDEVLAFNTAIKNIRDMGQTVDGFLDSMSKTKKVKFYKWLNKIKK